MEVTLKFKSRAFQNSYISSAKAPSPKFSETGQHIMLTILKLLKSFDLEVEQELQCLGKLLISAYKCLPLLCRSNMLLFYFAV